MESVRIDIPVDGLRAFCQRWGIGELSLFGSVLRDDFGPESDVDVLVEFEEGVERSYFDWPAMQEELGDLFAGRKIDLFTKNGVRGSANPWRRREILEGARRVYSAA